MHKFDAQQVEILGRNRLVNELLHAGIEVAVPARDRGIDLIAYIDRDENLGVFSAVPIQMKASSLRSFSVDEKYSKFPNLLIVFMWNLAIAESPITFAMPYSEAYKIAEEMGWATTQAWRNEKRYSTNNPSGNLCAMLEPHRMTSEKWLGLLSRKQTAG